MYYFDSKSTSSSYEFGKQLFQFISQEWHLEQPLVFLCIGSDRATGDSLGPIVGYKLKQRHYGSFYVYGTLDEPVHAKNLESIVSLIHKEHHSPYIIAIDASLGKSSHVGFYTLGQGALKPGAGVGKELPNVGNLFVTGIVNLSGLFEHTLLQTTRLQVVMSLADHICSGIFYCLMKLEQLYPQSRRMVETKKVASE